MVILNAWTKKKKKGWKLIEFTTYIPWKGISTRVNVSAWLEFELSNFKAAVLYSTH